MDWTSEISEGSQKIPTTRELIVPYEPDQDYTSMISFSTYG